MRDGHPVPRGKHRSGARHDSRLLCGDMLAIALDVGPGCRSEVQAADQSAADSVLELLEQSLAGFRKVAMLTGQQVHLYRHNRVMGRNQGEDLILAWVMIAIGIVTHVD